MAVEFQAAGTTVIGVSADSSFSHDVFAEELGLDFELLSDWNWEAARAFGVLREELLGYRPANNRGAFLVDAEGIVRHAFSSEDPFELPDAVEFLEAAQKLQASG